VLAEDRPLVWVLRETSPCAPNMFWAIRRALASSSQTGTPPS